MASKTDCMFALPYELTGIGTLCGLIKGSPCNGYGKKCTGYAPHTEESLEILDKVIKEKKSKENEVKDAD